MRVAVTGAGGRLGSALVKQLSAAPFVRQVLAWDLPEHDLDDPASARHLVSMYRPDAVVHAAAWTDVDGCARDPALAMRRNGDRRRRDGRGMRRARAPHSSWFRPTRSSTACAPTGCPTARPTRRIR